MKWFLILAIWCLPAASSSARLGDTHEQAQARYGLEKKEGVSKLGTPLLQGAKEVTFEYQGWRIRSALMLATDGKYYVVREEYRKIWSPAVQKAGGSPAIQDFECAAILEGERGNQSWRQKRVGDLGRDLSSTLGNQLALSGGLFGKIWIRDDGAQARCSAGQYALILELPHALKHEAELKAVKDQKARAAVPRF